MSGILRALSAAPPVYVAGGAVLAALIILGLTGTLRRFSGKADDVLTFVVAGMATATSAQGMWRFFGDSLGVREVYLRVLMCVTTRVEPGACHDAARTGCTRAGARTGGRAGTRTRKQAACCTWGR